MTQPHVVVMGVTGSGKSTVARALAGRLGRPYADGDDFHTARDVARMRVGTPLTDEARWPWLRAIRDWMADRHDEGRPAVVACSALRRAYRDLLRAAPGGVVFVHLSADPELVRARLRGRTNHFMHPVLVESQFATLEPLEPDEAGITVPVGTGPEQTVDIVLARLRLADS